MSSFFASSTGNGGTRSQHGGGWKSTRGGGGGGWGGDGKRQLTGLSTGGRVSMTNRSRRSLVTGLTAVLVLGLLTLAFFRNGDPSGDSVGGIDGGAGSGGGVHRRRKGTEGQEVKGWSPNLEPSKVQGRRESEEVELLKSQLSDTPTLAPVGGSSKVPQSSTQKRTRLPPPKIVDVNVRPVDRRWSGDRSEKFLTYWPHSGYHNQRIAFENALTLAKLLDRTLIVPPARLGSAIPYIAFDKLYDRVNQATKAGLGRCAMLGSGDLGVGGGQYGGMDLPAECLDYFDYTLVSWDFLVDMEEVVKTQSVVERWNSTYEWLEEEFGINRKRDIRFIKDERMYQYKIYDSEDDIKPLGRFETKLELSSLRSSDSKLLHFGTLFGTAKIRLFDKPNRAIKKGFRRDMMFKNPILDTITDTIKDRLGGGSGYYGVHIRLGDGIFQEKAGRNTREIFEVLVRDKIGLESGLVQMLLAEDGRGGGGKGKSAEGLVKLVKGMAGKMLSKRGIAEESLDDVGHELGGRGAEAELVRRAEVTEIEESDEPENTQLPLLNLPHQPTKKPLPENPPLPPLPTIRQRSDSPLHPSLSCRSPLHTSPTLLPLNAPLFISTDSRSPLTDPNLRIFFKTFPCTFVIGDFAGSGPSDVNKEPVEELRGLEGLRNRDDKVPLAGFFYPFVDAMVASKGRAVVGTADSTFSR